MSMWRGSLLGPATRAQNLAQIKRVCSFLRGNCPCGKWLVLTPAAYSKAKPFTCEGPCHQNKPCGITYWYEDKWQSSIEIRG